MSNRPIATDKDVRRDIETPRKIDGWTTEQVDDRDFNQLAFRAHADHLWGTATQVSLGEADFYTDASGNTIVKAGGSATILDDDKILMAHDVTLTAALVLDTGGKRIIVENFGGLTLDIDTFNLEFTDGDVIKGDLKVTGTGDVLAYNSPELMINNIRPVKLPEFKTDNLIIDVDSSTTVLCDADSATLLDDNNNGLFVGTISEVFNSATDLMAGTTLKLSTWYQMWIGTDYLGHKTRLLVPDIEGTATGTAAGFLVDGGGTFFTDLVKQIDVIYNTKTGAQTTVSVTPTVDGANLALTNDIFVSGDTYKIRLLSPTFPTTKIFKDRIGAAFRNSSGNFDDSYYTQIQERKKYLGDGTDFSVSSTPAVSSLINAYAYINQVNDWTGRGSWTIDYDVGYNVAPVANTQAIMTMTGILFGVTSSQFQAIMALTTSVVATPQSFAAPLTGSSTFNHASIVVDSYRFKGVSVELNKKPTFAI